MPNISTEGHNQQDWTPELIQRFWDYESQFPTVYYSFKYGEQIINRSLARLELSVKDFDSGAWLDFGCGFGSFTELLLKRGLKVTVFDSSPKSLAECNRRCAPYSNFLGAMEQCEEDIVAVTLLEVIEHVDFTTMKSIVQSLRQSCRPGARVLITTPNNEDLHSYSTTVYCPSCDTVRHRWQHLRSFTRDSLEKELVDLGLHDVEVFEENFRWDKRFRTANPLRLLKHAALDLRLLISKERPNLLAVARI